MKTHQDGEARLSWTRPQVAVLSVVIIAAALLLNYGIESTHANFEYQQRVESTYIVSHKCAIAQMSGRFPATYRCDVPESGRYLSASELAQEALKASSK